MFYSNNLIFILVLYVYFPEVDTDLSNYYFYSSYIRIFKFKFSLF